MRRCAKSRSPACSGPVYCNCRKRWSRFRQFPVRRRPPRIDLIMRSATPRRSKTACLTAPTAWSASHRTNKRPAVSCTCSRNAGSSGFAAIGDGSPNPNRSNGRPNLQMHPSEEARRARALSPCSKLDDHERPRQARRRAALFGSWPLASWMLVLFLLNRIRVEDRWVDLGPGMTVVAGVKTGKRRAIEFFLSVVAALPERGPARALTGSVPSSRRATEGREYRSRPPPEVPPHGRRAGRAEPGIGLRGPAAAAVATAPALNASV